MASHQFSIDVSASGCRRAGSMSLPSPKKSSANMTDTLVQRVVGDACSGDLVGVAGQRDAFGVDRLAEEGEVHGALQVEAVTHDALVVQVRVKPHGGFGAQAADVLEPLPGDDIALDIAC